MIVFYDGTCPLCNRAVRWILSVDKKRLFYFAPLEGKTAAKKQIHEKESLVLYINSKKIFKEGRAVFKILWLLGGKYALLGWLSFLPSLPFDLFYRLIAKYRFRLFSKKITIEKDDRFLP